MLTMWYVVFFFFKQKTAYELRISDWSSDVCSSDLLGRRFRDRVGAVRHLDDVAGDGGVPPDAGSVRCCPGAAVADGAARSEERRVGKEVSVRVDLGGRRIITTKKYSNRTTTTSSTDQPTYIVNTT